MDSETFDEILEEEQDFWTKALNAFPDDVLATCHLCFSLLVQKIIKGVKRGKQNENLLEYLKKASRFLRDCLKADHPSQTSFDGTIASFIWVQILEDVLTTTSEKEFSQREWYLDAFKMIIYKYEEIFKGKTFREFFNDIAFNTRGQFISPKAEKLITDYIGIAQDYFDDNEEWTEEDQEPQSWKEKLYEFYVHSWLETGRLIREIPIETALVFHATSLLLCHKIGLEQKAYSKYQKVVVKAVTSYKKNLNERQIEFDLTKADETYGKLETNCLNIQRMEFTEKDDSDKDLITKTGVYVVASEKALKNISDLDDEEVLKTLNDLKLNSDNFYTSDKIEEFCHQYRESAEISLQKYLEEIHREEKEEENGYEEEEEVEEFSDTKEIEENYTENRKDYTTTAEKPLEEKANLKLKTTEEYLNYLSTELENLDIEHDLFFHLVSLTILITKEIPKSVYSVYQNSVTQAVSCFTTTRNAEQRKNGRKNADQAFMNVMKDIYKKLDAKATEEEMKKNVKYFLVSTAIDFCMNGVPKIDKDSLETTLKRLKFDNATGEYYNEAIEAYTFKYVTNVYNLWAGKKL